MMRCVLFSIVVLMTCSKSFGQGYRLYDSKIGMQLGAFINFGTHEFGVGLQTKAYARFEYGQFNCGNTITWNFYGLGERKKFFQNRFYVGGAVMFGGKNAVVDFELDGLNHQSQRNFSVSYNFIIYSDNAQTSQLSGGFGLTLKNLIVKFENDVFAGQARDRFRTGILVFSYKQSWYRLSLGSSIWTGETRGSYWDKIVSYKMPSGYRSLEDLPYGKTSHGIVYGGVQFLLPGYNLAHLRVGVDSEHFRHLFQNRLFHDLMLLPEKLERNTPHYPRLDENGCPTFEKENVRKDRYYLQFGLND